MRRFVGAVAVVAATSGVLFAAQPAYATYPGRNGRISFRRYLNADHTWAAIFTINPDGTGERQVTRPKRGIQTSFQDVSPNGRWIAYQRTLACNRFCGPRLEDAIFKIRANGKDKTFLSGTCTSPCGSDSTPFWSPDGTLISFVRFSGTCKFGDPPCGFSAVFTMRADGSDLHQVTQVGATPDQLGYGDYSPIWSPDGTRFAFERYDPNKDKHAIFIVGIDGNGLRRITPWNRDAAEPDWSPNGRWIAFRTHKESDERGQLGLVHPNGNRLHLITSGKGKWLSCSFSPNGKKIVGAWPGGGLPGNADLYVMNLDGSHLRSITNSPPTWESSPDWGPRAS
jgi:TolB protein